MQRLLIATTNAGKVKEYAEMLSNSNIQYVSLADVGLASMDVEENGATFVANALLKAEAYAKASGLPTLADDSGLVVDALDGAPGIHSARYAPTAAERNQKLLKAIEEVPYEKRTARFVAVIALVLPDGVTVTAEGRVEGRIAPAPRGEHGFGYDPVFLVDERRTMAELLPEEKNAISHRGRAMARLYPILQCIFGK